ncbi:MAG: hypothetical protein AABW45_03555 [Nanoarchaeota archaeon]
MATILESLGFLEFFLPVFSFLFIFVIMYAVLDKFKLMGENKTLKFIASLSIALLFLFSKETLNFVNFVTPWFVVLVIIALFILSLFMFMGIKEKSMETTMGDPRVYWTVLVIIIILLIAAIGTVFSDFFSAEGGEITDPTKASITQILVHPRVLGALFLLVIVSFAIKNIAGVVESK